MVGYERGKSAANVDESHAYVEGRREGLAFGLTIGGAILTGLGWWLSRRR